MATYFRRIDADIQASEATAAKRTVYFEVGAHEAQTVTVSKAGGAFGATAGTTATQVDGTCYKLVIHADDIDTQGALAFKCVGATDTQYLLGLRVVAHDPFDDVQLIRQCAAGKLVTDSTAKTVKVYDTNGVTLLVTLTMTEAGVNITRAPS